jgi:hypothetical protein
MLMTPWPPKSWHRDKSIKKPESYIVRAQWQDANRKETRPGNRLEKLFGERLGGALPKTWQRAADVSVPVKLAASITKPDFHRSRGAGLQWRGCVITFQSVEVGPARN